MKAKITIILLCICLIFLSYFFYSESKIKDLAFDNIEALATDEDDGWIRCIGSGPYDCYGRKVEFRMDNIR